MHKDYLKNMLVMYKIVFINKKALYIGEEDVEYNYIL